MKHNKDSAVYGKWQTWFAWYPVKITVLYKFGRRSDCRIAWFKSVVRRTVTDNGITNWQYVLHDDLSDYLTLEYGELNRQAPKQNNDSTY